jgi:glucose-1-phosphate thymidylyltransferase
LKAIILLAGLGTRLRPHTYSRPKPLVNVAGKPVLGHILDSMANLTLEETIFVVGYLGDQIQDYVSKTHPNLLARYVEQQEMQGQAHAIALAKEYIDQPVLVIFGDTIWETDWTRLDRVAGEGLIFVKEVSDPRRFGVVTLQNGYVTRFVEKPDTPISNLAVVGVYYLKDWKGLVRAIDEVLAQGIQTKGEYYLADALQYMVARGAKLEAEVIPVWKDCGTREALLETNRYLLGKNGSHWPHTDQSQVIQPVYVAQDATIRRSIIGPYVSISSGAIIEDSILRDCIISEDSHIQNATLEFSLVGKDARVFGAFERLNVGDSSEIDFSK